MAEIEKSYSGGGDAFSKARSWEGKTGLVRRFINPGVGTQNSHSIGSRLSQVCRASKETTGKVVPFSSSDMCNLRDLRVYSVCCASV